MINLCLNQSWLDKSSETAMEEYKASLVEYLNSQYSDRKIDERWSITKVSEGDLASLIYDEKTVATFAITSAGLQIVAESDQVARYDDLMFGIRLVARDLGFVCNSNSHGGARLPIDPMLALDHTFFSNNKDFSLFFQNSNFIPRYCVEQYELRNGQGQISINPPYYLEDERDGTIHIANQTFLNYLVQKADQSLGTEFSYQVANDMDDFARKYDLGLIPRSFYQSYGKDIQIINDTDFEIGTIERKVFIDPYVWDFDTDKDNRYFENLSNGLHFMDKIRFGENLTTAVRRILREELKLSGDYVGIRIWGLDVDRDRDGILTPRLRMNIYVHGLSDKHRSDTHDWVSVR
jgi:hypothetical protein